MKLTNNYTLWTQEEAELLKKVYPTESWEDLVKFFPNRSRLAIKKKAKHFMLRKKREFTKKITKCIICKKETTIQNFKR